MPELNYIEVTGVITGLLGVWLAARQNAWTWPVGLVGITATIFYNIELKLYADVGLHIFYFGSSLFGWYEWLYGGRDNKELPVSKLNRSQTGLTLVTGFAFTGLLAYIFRTYTDASFPIFDSGLVAFSLVGTVLLMRKKIENWILWLIVDSGYVILYLLKGSYMYAGMYFVFLILALQGYLNWRRTLQPAIA